MPPRTVAFATCHCCKLTPEDYVKNKSEVGHCKTDPGLQQRMSGTLRLYLVWREFPKIPKLTTKELALFDALQQTQLRMGHPTDDLFSRELQD